MLDDESRDLIVKRLGKAVDDLVSDLYSKTTGGVSVVQEAEITSRLCQRLEDKLDNSQVGGYVFRVIAQSLPDRLLSRMCSAWNCYFLQPHGIKSHFCG